MSKRCLTCYYHKQRWEEAEGENRRLKAENERLRENNDEFEYDELAVEERNDD
jgi:cell division protein FtsB